MKYTQREWDRVVGYGKVPEQYSAVPNRITEVRLGRQMERIVQRSEENREEVKGVVAETNPIKSHENP